VPVEIQVRFGTASGHHAVGRSVETVSRKDQANACNDRGVVLAAQGRIGEAIVQYEQALILYPDHADAHSNWGAALATQGRFAEAIAHFERGLAIRPDHASAHSNLAVALMAQGRIPDAISHYERALALNPNHADAHNNLGLALAREGRNTEAIAHYERALAIRPDHGNAHSNLGAAFMRQGRTRDAISHYQRAIALNPNHADAHSNLGSALALQGRTADAIAHFERALALRPDHADAHNNLGVALMGQGRGREAIAHYDRALAVRPDHGTIHSNLGTALAEQGRLADARTHLDRALFLDPDLADAHNSLGKILKDEGKFDEALEKFERAIALRPDYGEAHLNRSQVKSFQRGDAELAVMEELAAKNNISPVTAMYMHFALGKALEDTGDYVRAFEHLREGNALKRGQIRYNETATLGTFERIAALFNDSLFERFQGVGDPSPVPIFVLGMPRSGSTLIEQILASHPAIHGGGELTELEAAATIVLKEANRPVKYPECVPTLDGPTLRRIGQAYLSRLPALMDGKIRIVDKMPGNFFKIGLIRLVLPNAKIIHTMRDPIDTCVSCYSKLFASGHRYTYDLTELGRYYRCYETLMAHWRSVLSPGAMLDVSYEDVVDDLEGQTRRLIEYCGLPWDDRCLSFHKTNRPVATASAVQVRTPLFRSSLARWRKYETGIGPLLRELQSQQTGAECTASGIAERTLY
jgi:tetratricopeptide (TPR) repeat protein